MNIRVAGLVLPVVAGIGVAVTSCSAPGTAQPVVSATGPVSSIAISGSFTASSTASPAVSISPGPVPAGYQRVGGAAQGISVAAPASWAVVNLAGETVQSAASKMNLRGASGTAIRADMESGLKWHAVFAFDVKTAVDDPLPPDLNAFCLQTGTIGVGAVGVPLLTAVSASAVERLGATHITQKDLDIGGVPGVETSFQVSYSRGTVHSSELAVFPKRGEECEVAVAGPSEASLASVAAATAQFP
jgi:hypothetical protein